MKTIRQNKACKTHTMTTKTMKHQTEKHVITEKKKHNMKKKTWNKH